MMLENAFVTNADVVQFNVSGRGYCVDIKKMIQTNTATKVDRNVRRTPVDEKEAEPTINEGAGSTSSNEAESTVSVRSRKRPKQAELDTESSKVPKGKECCDHLIHH